MLRRIFGLGAASALACIVLTGVANAEPTTYTGTVPNGGCDGQRIVTVSGPTRIEAEVGSTDAANHVFAYILDQNQRAVAEGSYDTTSAGTYYIRICAWYDHISPPTLQFTARYATGPAGQPALPRAQGGVLGATTTLQRDVYGTGAIRTKAGLAWFKVSVGPTGVATVRVYNPRANTHSTFTGARVVYGTNAVRIVRGAMRLTISQIGSTERITFTSSRFKASGKVVRGGYIIV
jgi:hypothetical protein